MSRDVARQVLDAEAEAIRNLMDTLGGDFDGAVKLITGCTGRPGDLHLRRNHAENG